MPVAGDWAGQRWRRSHALQDARVQAEEKEGARTQAQLQEQCSGADWQNKSGPQGQPITEWRTKCKELVAGLSRDGAERTQREEQRSRLKKKQSQA